MKAPYGAPAARALSNTSRDGYLGAIMPNTACPPAIAQNPHDSDAVAVLMGVYEGETYLAEQLDSLAAQTHTNWSLTVSDDSATPGSAQLIAQWHSARPDLELRVVTGPRRGFARNFLSLIAQTPPEAPFAALCDQDDVWFADKLARAVAALEQVPQDHPALYCAATTICDANLQNRHPSPVFRKEPDFCNAAVQSIGGGNTMVLNRAALDLAQRCMPPEADPVAHDWWLYQIVSGHGGTILRDPRAALLYRQHPTNAIGANMSYKARASRLRALLGARFRNWNSTNLAALQTALPHLTPQARHTLAQFQTACTGGVFTRLRALYRSGVFRQTCSGTLALYIACLTKRL